LDIINDLSTLIGSDSTNWLLWGCQIGHATLCCCRWGTFFGPCV